MSAIITARPNVENVVAVSDTTRPVTHVADTVVKRASATPTLRPSADAIGNSNRKKPMMSTSKKLVIIIRAGFASNHLKNSCVLRLRISIYGRTISFHICSMLFLEQTRTISSPACITVSPRGVIISPALVVMTTTLAPDGNE